MLKRHIRRRAAKIGMLIATVLTFFLFYETSLNPRTEKAELIAYANDIGVQVKDSLLSEIKCTEQAVRSAATALSEQLKQLKTKRFAPILIKRQVTTIMESCKDLDGAFIILESNGRLLQNKKGTALCIIRKRDSLLHFDLSSIYNTPLKLQQAPWHMLPNDSASAWVAPYYSINAQRKMAAYISTFSLTKDIKCYVGAAYTTTDIYNMINRWKSGRLGYPYLINRKGEFIAHPNDENRPLLQIGMDYNEKTLIKLANAIKSSKPQKAQHYYHRNTVSKAMCWEHIIPIKEMDWYLGISVSDQQVYSNPTYFNQQRKYKILISFLFFGSLLLAEIIILLFLFRKEDAIKLAGIAVSVFFVIEILLIFSISLRYPSYNFSDMELRNFSTKKSNTTPAYSLQSKETNKQLKWESRWNYSMLLDNEGTSDYIRNYLNNFHKKINVPFVQIPTGVYIQTVRFTDSYETKLSGYIWQLYPTRLPVKHGIMLPDAETSNIELKDSATIILPNYQEATFYRWHFTADIREQYEFKQYPFDYNALWLRIWSVDFENNVVLVPDFRSYKLLHPSFKPGLDNDIIIPGWDIQGSYFSFKEKNYNANFDPEHNLSRVSFPELNFNIILEREYLDSIITRMVPILVLLFMTYSILYISKREDALNVAIACSGLLFVAVLEHVNLRRNLDSSGLIYMEYYYFVTYFLLMFVSVNIVINDRFSKILPRTLNFSQLSTIAYWPIALLLIFIATIITFL